MERPVFSRLGFRYKLTVALLIVTGAAIGTSCATNSSDPEIREVLAELQYIPEDELPLPALRMEP